MTTTDEPTDIELYMDFTPEDLTIAPGDCVEFVMSRTHNAVEVSQATYDERGVTPLDGGFAVQYGATEQVQFNEPGVHSYICQPHVNTGMVGTITVQ